MADFDNADLWIFEKTLLDLNTYLLGVILKYIWLMRRRIKPDLKGMDGYGADEPGSVPR